MALSGKNRRKRRGAAANQGVQAVVEQHVVRRAVRFPYVPGLLSFREAPAILAVLRKLRCAPDAFLFDGQGFAHPRRFGLACHVGLLVDRPSLGCAFGPERERHETCQS